MVNNSKKCKGDGSPTPKLKMFWGFFVLISNNLILPVVSTTSNSNIFQDGKNYYSSPVDPNPPSGVHSNPSHSPTHHHHTSKPSSGGQSNCGVPSVPPPSSGGSGGCQCPSPPSPRGGSGGSGGYYHHPPSPKTPSHKTPPTPLVPSPPYEPPVTPTPRPSLPPPSSGGGGGGYYGPPTTPGSPLVPSPPVTPVLPSPPLVPSPTPFDPNAPFPCTYWGSHPGLIFGVLGWWATVGGLFGITTLPGLSSSDYSLQDVLNNPRRDGYTSLYREGTASFLNSMATHNFPFSSNQVKASLLASLHSHKAAAAQARLFKLANEGKLKVAV